MERRINGTLLLDSNEWSKTYQLPVRSCHPITLDRSRTKHQRRGLFVLTGSKHLVEEPNYPRRQTRSVGLQTVGLGRTSGQVCRRAKGIIAARRQAATNKLSRAPLNFSVSRTGVATIVKRSV